MLKDESSDTDILPLPTPLKAGSCQPKKQLMAAAVFDSDVGQPLTPESVSKVGMANLQLLLGPGSLPTLAHITPGCMVKLTCSDGSTYFVIDKVVNGIARCVTANGSFFDLDEASPALEQFELQGVS